jgi:DNA-binding NtrC family response regulator
METTLIGVSPSIKKIRELINQIASTGLNAVIRGEIGVGKEVVVRALYDNSSRKGSPFVKINCAELPDEMLECELFGYERGAFAGAKRRRRGKFELADGGVLFLDNIGNISNTLQAKLHQVFQTGRYVPIGSKKDFKTDTWVIASANPEQDADKKIKPINEDLYSRLSIVNIYIPPLRERPEDILPLIEYYVEKYGYRFENRHFSMPNESVVRKLSAFRWPGNVEELHEVVKRFLVLGDWDRIAEELTNVEDGKSYPSRDRSSPTASTIVSDLLDFDIEGSQKPSSFSLKKITKKAVDQAEKEIIYYILDQTGWNRRKAAKILKINYKTLLYKINDLKIGSDLLDLEGEDSPNLASFSLKKTRKKAHDRAEKEVISYILDQTDWNRSKAAKILKISYRALLYKINDLKIEPPVSSSAEAA